MLAGIASYMSLLNGKADEIVTLHAVNSWLRKTEKIQMKTCT